MSLVSFAQADLDLALPVGRNPFDAVMSLDVVLHLRDRRALFEWVTEVLRPNWRLLFTDAGVVSGPVSSEEFQRRGAHGFTQFVPTGFNERLIAAVGLRSSRPRCAPRACRAMPVAGWARSNPTVKRWRSVSARPRSTGSGPISKRWPSFPSAARCRAGCTSRKKTHPGSI